MAPYGARANSGVPGPALLHRVSRHRTDEYARRHRSRRHRAGRHRSSPPTSAGPCHAAERPSRAAKNHAVAIAAVLDGRRRNRRRRHRGGRRARAAGACPRRRTSAPRRHAHRGSPSRSRRTWTGEQAARGRPAAPRPWRACQRSGLPLPDRPFRPRLRDPIGERGPGLPGLLPIARAGWGRISTTAYRFVEARQLPQDVSRSVKRCAPVTADFKRRACAPEHRVT
jgi:hypothetical protein